MTYQVDHVVYISAVIELYDDNIFVLHPNCAGACCTLSKKETTNSIITFSLRIIRLEEMHRKQLSEHLIPLRPVGKLQSMQIVECK